MRRFGKTLRGRRASRAVGWTSGSDHFSLMDRFVWIRCWLRIDGREWTRLVSGFLQFLRLFLRIFRCCVWRPGRLKFVAGVVCYAEYRVCRGYETGRGSGISIFSGVCCGYEGFWLRAGLEKAAGRT